MNIGQNLIESQCMTYTNFEVLGGKFLAAMSSSRSDGVTQFVRLSVRLSVRVYPRSFFKPKEFQ